MTTRSLAIREKYISDEYFGTVTMETTFVNLSLQNVSSDPTNAEEIRDSGEKSSDIGILWLPYFLLILLLVGMAAGSFIKYHCRNKGKYRGKKYLSTDPEVYHKHRVTMNKNGTMPLRANPEKVIAELPRSNTPDLTRSTRWQYPFYPIRKPRYEPSGKFENAGYFLDKLADRRKSRPFSYLNPGFVKSSPRINRLSVTRNEQSPFDENPTSATSSASHWNQHSQFETSESNTTETELQYLSESPPVPPKINAHLANSNNVIPPTPPRRNKYNINRYKINLQKAHSHVHQGVEEDSGYHSNHPEHNIGGQNLHFHGNHLPAKSCDHSVPCDSYEYSLPQSSVHDNNCCQCYTVDSGLHRGDYSINSSVSLKTEPEIRNSAYHRDCHINDGGNLVAMDTFLQGDSCSAPLELTATNLMLAHHQQTLKSGI